MRHSGTFRLMACTEWFLIGNKPPEDFDTIRGEKAAAGILQDLPDIHKPAAFYLFFLQGERPLVPALEDPSPDPVVAIGKVVVKTVDQQYIMDAQFLIQLTFGSILIIFTGQDYTAGGNIIMARVDVLGHGSLLDEQLPHPVEYQDIDSTMNEVLFPH